MIDTVINLFTKTSQIFPKNSQICNEITKLKRMKKYLLLCLAVLMYTKGFSISDKFKIGLFASPGLSWMKPMGNEINNGFVGFGMQYGVKIDYYFKDQNYGISTGLFGGVDGGGLHGRDTLTSLNHGYAISEHYTTNEVILPLYLKLKTNPFKRKFKLYGEFGFQMVFNVSARANYSAPVASPYLGGQLVNIYKENVLRNGNEVQELIPGFRYNPFDFRLSAGGGMEYAVAEKTSLFFAIHYNNGFINAINDKSVNPKHDGTVVRNLLFTVGAMF